MAKREVSKSKILEMWQLAHGKLSARWQSEFLGRPELEEIVLYPTHAVADALAHSHELRLILRHLKLRWVKSVSHEAPRAGSAKIPISKVKPESLPRPSRRTKSTLLGEKNAVKRKREVASRDLAAEGKILPLPDSPIRSRKRGSPGYKTGIEAELRSIAQKHKWF